MECRTAYKYLVSLNQLFHKRQILHATGATSGKKTSGPVKAIWCFRRVTVYFYSLFNIRESRCELPDSFTAPENSRHWDGTSNPFCKLTFLPWGSFLKIFEEELHQDLVSHPTKRVLKSAETSWNPKAVPTQNRAELFVWVRVKESPVSFLGLRRVKLIFSASKESNDKI